MPCALVEIGGDKRYRNLANHREHALANKRSKASEHFLEPGSLSSPRAGPFTFPCEKGWAARPGAEGQVRSAF
jgi:hypothetical protein